MYMFWSIFIKKYAKKKVYYERIQINLCNGTDVFNIWCNSTIKSEAGQMRNNVEKSEHLC